MDSERREKLKKKKKDRMKMTKPYRIVLIVILVFAGIVIASSVKNIISLEIEHHKLMTENAQLKAQRKELELELKNVNSKQYIEEQARDQLRLVNQDEILFLFPDAKKTTATDDTKSAGDTTSTDSSGSN